MSIRYALLFLSAAACSDSSAGSSRDTPQRDTAGVVAAAETTPVRAPHAGGHAAAGIQTAATSHDARAADAQPHGAFPDSPLTTVAATRRPVIRGVYVNRFAAQSRNRMAALIAMADTTEINAFVIDIKDEFGINYRTEDSLVARNAGKGGSIPRLPELLDTLRAHGIVPIARIVVFKDSVAARVNPAWTIRKADGTPWRDREGLTWVNPHNRELWEYNFRVAEEVARLGFQEIQWDYIRFPEPYKSLPEQVFPGADGVSKSDALAAFLTEARTRLNRLGVASTADVFGLVATVPGTLEIGQKWEALAPVTDVLLPMVYPSHYPRGAFGVERPNAEPYRIVHQATLRAHQRSAALGIIGESVRPWLQAFTLGEPAYGAAELLEQKRGVYEAGFDGWILWHPGSRYEPFLAALEPRLESRRHPVPVVAQPPPPLR